MNADRTAHRYGIGALNPCVVDERALVAVVSGLPRTSLNWSHATAPRFSHRASFA